MNISAGKWLVIGMMAALAVSVGAGCARQDIHTQESSRAAVVSSPSTEEESLSPQSLPVPEGQVPLKGQEDSSGDRQTTSIPVDSDDNSSVTSDTVSEDEQSAVTEVSTSSPDEVSDMESSAAVVSADIPQEPLEESVVSAPSVVEPSEEVSKPEERSDEAVSAVLSEEPSENGMVLTANDVMGIWEYNVGSLYAGFMVNGDKTFSAYYQSGDIEQIVRGFWRIEDNKLRLSAEGETVWLTYRDDHLIEQGTTEHLYWRRDDTLLQNSSVSVDMLAGRWMYNDGSDYVILTLNEDGTAAVISNIDFFHGAEGINVWWTVADDQVTLLTDGEAEAFTFEHDRLIHNERENLVLFREQEN